MRPTASRDLVPLLIATLASAALLSGCASGPPPGPSPAELAGQNAKIIIISPFNVVSSLPPELEGSTKMVTNEMVEYLEAHGKTVKRMAFRAGRDLWKASMQEVSESGQARNFENAAKVFARKVGEHLEFDVVVVPSLFVQNAKVFGRRATWDDAEQTVAIEGSVATEGQMFQGQSGTMYLQGASLFLHLINREGEAIHTKRQGIEMIQHIELRSEAEAGYSSKREHSWHVVDDRPAITDEERVREAVAQAFVPFLPEEIPRQGPVTPFNAEAGSAAQ